MRQAMSAAVNGKEFHLHVGAVAPENLLSAHAIGHGGLVRCRRAGDMREVLRM